MRWRNTLAAGAAVAGVLFCAMAAIAQVPGYSTLYDPFNVLNLNFEMESGDWAAIQADSAYTLVKPAYFWADGENKILVSVKRKPNVGIGEKIALKVDINEYFGNLQWHGVKKLSLENGIDKSVAAEGFVWQMHQAAAAAYPAAYGVRPSGASWVNVNVNGSRIGVYANIEQPDETFFRNRDIWASGKSWLYKQGDIGTPEVREGPSDVSPTFAALNYQPFINKSAFGVPLRPTPSDAVLTTELPAYINMSNLLTVGAVNAFSSNPDELFNKGKNFFYADYSDGVAGGKRLFLPWDQDAVLQSETSSIYYLSRKQSGAVEKGVYQDIILDHPVFRAQYNQIMLDLLNGPLSVASLQGILDDLEPILTPWLIDDPNSNMGNTAGDIAGQFDAMRTWVANRHANVLSQVYADMGAKSAPEPGGMLLVVVLVAGLSRRPRGWRGRIR